MKKIMNFVVNKLNSFYNYNKIGFYLSLILSYIVLTDIGNILSNLIKIRSIITSVFLFVICFILYAWFKHHNKVEGYNIKEINFNLKKYLYCIPLLIVGLSSLLYGLNLNISFINSIFYIFTMIEMAILDEIIYRSMIFQLSDKINLKKNKLITFIILGIIFALNYVLTFPMANNIFIFLTQIIYGFCVGMMFSAFYYKTPNIVPCIISHALMNILSTFVYIESVLDIFICIVLTIIPVLYYFWIMLDEIFVKVEIRGNDGYLEDNKERQNNIEQINIESNENFENDGKK